MTTSEVVGHTSDGTVSSSNATYSTARSGSNLGADDSRTTLDQLVAGSFVGVGQHRNLFNFVYGITEVFLRFDVGSLPAGDVVTAATLRMYQDTGSSVSFDVEVREHDWGASVGTGDWVAGADLSSLPLLATLASSSSSSTSRDFTNNGSALVDAIEAARDDDGWLYVMLSSSRVRTNTSPNGLEAISFASSDNSTADRRPRLVIEHEVGADIIGGEALADLGSLTATSAGLRTAPGSAHVDLGPVAASSVGVRLTSGDSLSDLGGIAASAHGHRLLRGAAGSPLGGLNATAEGAPMVGGTALASLGALNAQATGNDYRIGSARSSLGAANAHASGIRSTIGAAATDLGALLAHVTLGQDGRASAALGSITALATGYLTPHGTASGKLGRLRGRVAHGAIRHTRIEIAFGHTWRDGIVGLTWVDVTDDVLVQEGLQISRGRSTEFDEPRAGSLALSLNNSDRRYDPLHDTGPHYGDLLPGAPIRVTRRGQPLFFGYVAEWPQTYDISNALASVPIEAYDLLSILARTRLPASAYEWVVSLYPNAAYWPLGETRGRLIEDVIGNRDATLTRDIDRTRRVMPFDTRTGIEFGGANRRAHVPDIDAGGAETISLWFVADQFDNATVFVHGTSETPQPIGSDTHIVVTVGSEIQVAIDDGTTLATGITTTSLEPGLLHHLVVAISPISATVWVDGVEAPWTVADPFSGVDLPTTLAAVSNVHFGWGVITPSAHTATLAHVTLFSSLIAADFMVEWLYEMATAPWAGQHTDERVFSILNLVGWPGTATDLDWGTGVLLGSADLAGTASEHLGRIQAAEQGRLFVAADGKVTLRHRYDTADAPDFTVTDTGDGTYSNSVINAPSSQLKNRVTVNPITLTDEASIDAYGEHAHDIDASLLPSLQRRRDLATYVLANHAHPVPRVYDLTIPLHVLDPSDATDVLALDIGDRVDFQRHPQGVGDPITLGHVIEGMQLTTDDTATFVTLYLSPNDTTKWWRAGLAEAGIDTRPGY